MKWNVSCLYIEKIVVLHMLCVGTSWRTEKKYLQPLFRIYNSEDKLWLQGCQILLLSYFLSTSMEQLKTMCNYLIDALFLKSIMAISRL
jgi:hypothetical protein